MVAGAGDEIYSLILVRYLLDFPEAERVKRQLVATEVIEFVDVLRLTHSLPATELCREIAPVVNQLAEQLAQEILRLNHDTCPQAVMCVGGGSPPRVNKQLAKHLGLPENRVALRDRTGVSKIAGCEEELFGPASVTPWALPCWPAVRMLRPFLISPLMAAKSTSY